jgi:sec-independent protein translocase protein TatC
MTDNDKLPFTEHLEELRERLIKCFIALGLSALVGYFFSKKIFQILTRPLIKIMPPGETLIFTNLPEAFFTYLKVSLLAGVFLALPVILYQIWSFISPGLYRKEKRYIFPFVILSTIFFIGGALFGYFIVFPIGFKFFLGFSTEFIRPLPSIREYLSFSSKLLLALGIVFELPILAVFLAKIGIIDAHFLSSKRKYGILFIFILGALLTPPDIVTQVMMALPLMLLYEISIWMIKIFARKKEDQN